MYVIVHCLHPLRVDCERERNHNYKGANPFYTLQRFLQIYHVVQVLVCTFVETRSVDESEFCSVVVQ